MCAEQIALLDASDAFRAMFDGGYKEQSTPTIEIPNITLAVWEAMMRCIYTGTVAVAPEMARVSPALTRSTRGWEGCTRPARCVSVERPTPCGKGRIARLGFGTGDRKWTFVQGHGQKKTRRTCCPRYWLQSWRRKSAGLIGPIRNFHFAVRPSSVDTARHCPSRVPRTVAR
jgi:hypothetical protein